MRRITRTLVPVLAIVALLVVSASPAFAMGRNLVGTWDAVATFDGGGEAPFLASYNRGGVWTSSGSSAGASAAHGAWERVGPGQYSTKSKIFFYDANGNLSAIGESQSEIQISQDGESYTGTFEATISLPDGTVVATNTGTESATRITVD